MIPFAVDSFGRWGDEAKAFIERACKRAAKGDHNLYNLLITRARDTIQVAHANAVGEGIARGLSVCVRWDEKHCLGIKKRRSAR